MQTVQVRTSQVSAGLSVSASRAKRPDGVPKAVKPGDDNPTAPSRSVFSGRGLFTPWDPSPPQGKGADWVALPVDPEGHPEKFEPPPGGRVCWGQARPGQAHGAVAAHVGAPYTS